MSTAANKSRVAQFLGGARGIADPATIAEYVDENASETYWSSLLRASIAASFPDLHATIEDLIADGDTVVCRRSWAGTHGFAFAGIAATGKTVRSDVIDVFRFAAGKIVENRQTWDLPGLMRQITALDLDPVIDVDDVQGNIVPGFNKDHVQLICLEIGDRAGARAWLRALQPYIATVAEVDLFKRVFNATRMRRHGREGTVKATWTNVAFSYPGLRKLARDADAFADAAFKAGLPARSRSLGDSPGSAKRWVVGAPGAIPDAIVIVASDDADDLAAEVARIDASYGSALRTIWTQRGRTLPEPLTGHEPFGFLDGISQPGVRGRYSTDPSRFITPRDDPADPDHGRPGQVLRPPGQFLLGYSGGPVAPPWAKNGSFLVFRRYRQDVDAFAAFLRSSASSLARHHPALRGMTAERLGALLVGRWKSGAPIELAPDRDAPSMGADPHTNNEFTFSAGPGGEVCPLGAHIRKANPRSDTISGVADPAAAMILRRGIPYEHHGEQGLLFVSYQASIENQFEFIVKNWLNNADFRRPAEGYDPIVGQAGGGPRSVSLPVPQPGGGVGSVELELPAEYVVPTGGGYFFAPSISALKMLGAG